MADSVTTALVAAGAALVGSGVTGFITLRGIDVKSNSDRKDLTTRLNHETAAARENREQERRQRAYISLLTHIDLLRYFMNINFRIVKREYDAVKAVRDADGQAKIGSAAEKTALDKARPTDEEEEALAAVPTPKEGAETVALVYALASDQVRQQFDVLTRADVELGKEMSNIRRTLRRGESSEPVVNEAVSPAARKALARIHESADALADGVGNLYSFAKISAALGQFNKALDNLEEMVRAELRSTLAAVDQSSATPQESRSSLATSLRHFFARRVGGADGRVQLDSDRI